MVQRLVATPRRFIIFLFDFLIHLVVIVNADDILLPCAADSHQHLVESVIGHNKSNFFPYCVSGNVDAVFRNESMKPWETFRPIDKHIHPVRPNRQ